MHLRQPLESLYAILCKIIWAGIFYWELPYLMFIEHQDVVRYFTCKLITCYILHVISLGLLMATKKPSYYQSKYRERLREQGYVKREVWIPPDYA